MTTKTKPKAGTLELDGFTIRAEVVAPGILVVTKPGAMAINNDEVPEGSAITSPGWDSENGDTNIYTNRRAVIQRLLRSMGHSDALPKRRA
ncbi:MAG: hypothetical protein WC943_13840 [Elusimicrobiota bacterium]|jgi:hypothetical protein